MRWSPGPGAGFTTGEPWLPLGAGANVAEQREDPGSLLNLARDLISRRRRLGASYHALEATEQSWAYQRGDATVRLDFARAEATLSP